MPMDSTVLANIIKVNMEAIRDTYQNGEKSPDDTYTAFAEAIITHITVSAQVNLTTGKIT